MLENSYKILKNLCKRCNRSTPNGAYWGEDLVGKELRCLEDNRIVELYLLRDEDAIRQTAEKYGSRLRAVSYNIVSDSLTAEECENDTYMEAWKRIPPL